MRTDPTEKPQRGISFLLIDLRSPGVNVRPITMINGAHYVNEIFLENVVVPVENRVGDEGKGWSCTKFLLEHVRASRRSRKNIFAKLAWALSGPCRVLPADPAGWRCALV